MTLTRLLLNVLLLTLFLGLLIVLIRKLDPTGNFIHADIWTILLFSALVGVGIGVVNHVGIQRLDKLGLPNLFLLTTVIRLVASAAFVGVILFRGIENRVVWVLDFFTVYLCYLIFEIYSIISNLRAISKEGKNQ